MKDWAPTGWKSTLGIGAALAGANPWLLGALVAASPKISGGVMHTLSLAARPGKWAKKGIEKTAGVQQGAFQANRFANLEKHVEDEEEDYENR